MIIRLKARGDRLSFTSVSAVTSGASNFYEIRVDFDEAWDDATERYVVFPEYKCDALLDEDNAAVIPSEVIKTPGPRLMGVIGKGDGDLIITTNALRLRVNKGVTEEDVYPTPPERNLWRSYIESIAKKVVEEALASEGSSSLPVATADVLGGVKIGEYINVTEDGMISVDTSAVSAAVTGGTVATDGDVDAALEGLFG